MIPATQRQKQLLDAIVRLSAGGVAPTLDELAREVGCASKSSIHKTLVSLRERGLITWAPHLARSIHVVQPVERQTKDLVAALRDAEDFIAGFSDDPTQVGVGELLAKIWAALEPFDGPPA